MSRCCSEISTTREGAELGLNLRRESLFGTNFLSQQSRTFKYCRSNTDMGAFDLKFTTLFTLTGTVLHDMVVHCIAALHFTFCYASFHCGTLYCMFYC